MKKARTAIIALTILWVLLPQDVGAAQRSLVHDLRGSLLVRSDLPPHFGLLKMKVLANTAQASPNCRLGSSSSDSLWAQTAWEASARSGPVSGVLLLCAYLSRSERQAATVYNRQLAVYHASLSRSVSPNRPGGAPVAWPVRRIADGTYASCNHPASTDLYFCQLAFRHSNVMVAMALTALKHSIGPAERARLLALATRLNSRLH